MNIIWIYIILFSLKTKTNPSATINQELLVKQAKQTADLAVLELKNMVRTSHPVIRLAGISGALAVALGF